MYYNNEDKYEAIIGLEVHAELKTETKIFCSCSTEFGSEPNTHICPTCYGMPGTLPVLNKKAVELAVRAGLALNCDINRTSWFDRKNYFYPDLPKGYQITQYERPICEHGAVPIKIGEARRDIKLTRIHIEEDAGKLIHRDDKTLVDYNRCGVPLIEIVCEPDMRTPDEAKAYLNSLRRILSYIGVSDCKMNEGSLRCDVNVSVRLRGEEKLGVKCEIKNLNSVNYVGRALEDEIARQISIIEAGGTVEPETRRYNEDTGHTEHMRRKETVVDYRYLAEPNIPALVLTEDDIDSIKRLMPKMPDEVAEILVKEYSVKEDDAQLITSSRKQAEYFMQCAQTTKYRQQCANLFVGEILPKLSSNNADFDEKTVILPKYFGEICDLFGDGKIVSGVAKKLIELCIERNESPLTIAKNENLLKITDEEILLPMVKRALENDTKSVSDYLSGKKTALSRLLGAVMRESAGGADPVAVQKLLEREVAKN